MPARRQVVTTLTHGAPYPPLKPEGLHHAPMDLEKNSPASIIMLIQIARELGKPVNVDEIEKLAKQELRYLQAIERGHLPLWHELEASRVDPIQAEKERQERRAKLHRQLIHLHCCDCEGDTLRSLDTLAGILEQKGVSL